MENGIDGRQEVEDQIQELRARLIEQEHRPHAVFLNLYRSFIEKEKKDSKNTSSPEEQAQFRNASLYAAAALLGRWFFRRSVVTGSIGILGAIGGIVTLYLGWQTLDISRDTLEEFSSQNTELQLQNEFLRAQNEQFQRSNNSGALADLLADIASERAQLGVAPIEERKWEVQPLTAYRIATVASSLVPYESFDASNILPGAANNLLLSPERGLLLASLFEQGVSFPIQPAPTFRSSYLERFDFVGPQLANIDLSESGLRISVYRGSITDATFDRVTGIIDFDQSRLSNVTFREADVRLAFKNSRLNNLSVQGLGAASSVTFGNSIIERLHVDLPSLNARSICTADSIRGLSIEAHQLDESFGSKAEFAQLADVIELCSTCGEKIEFYTYLDPAGGSNAGASGIPGVPAFASQASCSTLRLGPHFSPAQSTWWELSDAAREIVADILRLTEVREGGAVAGYRVAAGPNQQQFANLGFNDGDVITDIDRRTVAIQSYEYFILEQLASAPASVRVLRGSESVELSIDLTTIDSAPQ